jgi:hypothetical protein
MTNETASINETSAAENATSANATNATAEQVFWLPEYNDDSYTYEMVVMNLTERGIYPDFELWYNTFFGINGIVVQDMQANATNATN